METTHLSEAVKRMDLAAEFAAVDRRIRRQIDASARAAIARMDAKWPNPNAVVIETPRNPVEAYGQALRELQDGLQAFAQAFATGWTAIDRAQPTEQGGNHV